MVPIEDDRSSASNVADGPSDPIDEDTLNDRNAGKFDDRLHVYRWFLAGEREDSPRSSTSELVPRATNFGESIHGHRILNQQME